AGTQALPCPGEGVFIQSQANTIGGPAAAQGNLISGCGVGVQMAGPGAFGNFVTSNSIGTDATGSLPIPNFVGVSMQAGPEANSILRSRIAFNGSEGVSILDEPASGGASCRFNSVLYNSISSNGGLGINLALGAQDGVTQNDPCDADTGPNFLQNYP